MAINYQSIQNEKLRLLCLNSVSINYLPENQRQNVIDKIAGLTPEKQQQVIDLLENEQQQIKENASAQNPQSAQEFQVAESTEQQLKEIEDSERQLASIEHEYDAKIRNINEAASKVEDSAAAENLLNLLEKL